MHPRTPKTDRVRVHFREISRVRARPEAIFPLLCPVREHDWIPGWRCEMIYTESGVAEDGCIFQTDQPADGNTDTWVVSRYEPTRRISFVRVNPLRAIRYDFTLDPDGDDATNIIWQQEITALDEAGDRHVADLEGQDFATLVETEGRMLEHYLKTGEALDV